MSKKFTERQTMDIMYEGGVWSEPTEENENGIQTFETIQEEIISTDSEKGSSDHYYVIEEVATGKYFSATLGQSPWCDQDRVNAEANWREVKRKEVTTIVYG